MKRRGISNVLIKLRNAKKQTSKDIRKDFKKLMNDIGVKEKTVQKITPIKEEFSKKEREKFKNEIKNIIIQNQSEKNFGVQQIPNNQPIVPSVVQYLPAPKQEIIIRKEDLDERVNLDKSVVKEQSGEGTDLKKVQKEQQVDFEKFAARNKKTDLKHINERFSLIDLETEAGKKVLIDGTIKFNKISNDLKYEVQEPPLDDNEKKILKNIKIALERKLNIFFQQQEKQSSFNYLTTEVKKLEKKMGLKLRDDQQKKIYYYIYRDFIGYGKIEPLMNDPNIEDISCDGIGVPIFIYHKNPAYGGLETNIAFNTKEELDSFVLRLSQKTGKTINVATPLLDGALPDGSRVQATYGSDVSTRGSNFTIRKFSKEPMTPTKLIEFGTANSEVLAYLWLAIENGLSILISGATATGKTSFLAAISLFIQSERKIISIEDTPELKLPHPNWISEVSRTGFGNEKYGEVTLFDLLKASLRQRPDYIIIGEVRGVEANVLFQAMATGHGALGTIHADTISKVFDRLTTAPISLPAGLLQNLDLVVFLVLFKDGENYVRRIKQVDEIIGFDKKTGQLVTNPSFKFNTQTKEFESLTSKIVEKIKEKVGYSEAEIIREIQNRIKLIDWMYKNNLKDYKSFYANVKKYYSEREDFIKQLS